MNEFIDTAESVLRSDRCGHDKPAFELVFKAIAALQSVYAKALIRSGARKNGRYVVVDLSSVDGIWDAGAASLTAPGLYRRHRLGNMSSPGLGRPTESHSRAWSHTR